MRSRLAGCRIANTARNCARQSLPRRWAPLSSGTILFIYGTAAGLVFPKLFFPNESLLAATLASFSTYFIGFVGRPIGAAIFGHYGDRIGRKATLISTLLLMGVATFLVAFVPGYEAIGIWGAIILTILRTLQGIGVGGEWGGSVLIAMEWSRGHARRGLIASWPQFGVPAGLFLANLAILLFSTWSDDELSRLGMARAVRAQHGTRRRWPLDSHRHSGNSGVQEPG